MNAQTLHTHGTHTHLPLHNGLSQKPEYSPHTHHTHTQGRKLIYHTMTDANCDFAWIEVNAQHAFIRDELSKGRCVFFSIVVCI